MSKLAFIIPYDMDLAENQLNHYKEILKNFQSQNQQKEYFLLVKKMVLI